MRHTEDGVHRRTNFVAHVREKLRLCLGGGDGRFLGGYKFCFHHLEFGNILRDSVHISGFPIRIFYNSPKSMSPSDPSINWAFIREGRIEDVSLSLNSIAECLPSDFGGGFITLFRVGEELFEPISIIRTWNVSENCGPAGGGVVPSGAVQGDVPVTCFGEFQRSLREEVGTAKFFLTLPKKILCRPAFRNILLQGDHIPWSARRIPEQRESDTGNN